MLQQEPFDAVISQFRRTLFLTAKIVVKKIKGIHDEACCMPIQKKKKRRKRPCSGQSL
jgi:hypothetical protein